MSTTEKARREVEERRDREQMANRKLRVISDGTSFGTDVIHVASGRSLIHDKQIGSCVKNLRLHIPGWGFSEITLETERVPVEFEGFLGKVIERVCCACCEDPEHHDTKSLRSAICPAEREMESTRRREAAKGKP